VETEHPEQVEARQVVLTMHRSRSELIRISVPYGHAVLENNLTRKGVWATDPSRGGPVQESFEFEADDVVGRLVITSSLGRLSTMEMEIFGWTLARWLELEDPSTAVVTFTLRGLARAMGVEWGGSCAERFKDALDRMAAVHFKAEVWSEAKQELVTESFNLFDRVTIKERKAGRHGSSGGNPPVRVRLGEFVHQQLQAGQFHRYSWQVLRGALTTPLAKRLYVFVEAQRGRKTTHGWLYEHAIDSTLLTTLGVRDTRVRRVRAKIRQAGEEILAADSKFLECGVREGRRGWLLHVVRDR